MGKYWTPTRKGAINTSHALARNAIAEVYKLKGGVQGLWNWACKNDANESAFYTILLPKLIPAEIADQHGATGATIQVVIAPANTSVVQTPQLETITEKPLDVMPAQDGGAVSAAGGGE